MLSVIRGDAKFSDCCTLKFIISMTVMDGNIPDVNDTDAISVTSVSPVLPQTPAN